MSIQENIAAIREEIDRAARESGRTGRDITLVGASKMNDAATCREAIAAGIDVLGENRVQEMTEKLAQHAYDGAPLHFIGHLQRNKVKQVVGKAALIQSVGSEALLAEIEKTAEKLELVQNILLDRRLGEGSGCPVMFQVLRAACAVINGMATFPEAAIEDSYLEPIRRGDSFTVDAP